MDTAINFPTAAEKVTPIVEPKSALDAFMPVLFLGSYVFAAAFLLYTGATIF